MLYSFTIGNDDSFTSSYRIVAGEHSLKTESGDEQNRAISKATVNENYISSTFENDISLIFVK